MKIVIAPDSFKDSLGAAEAAEAIALGLQEAFPQAEFVLCPMADGGEGTIDAILAALGGELRSDEVSGPLGEQVSARWGWLADTRTAIIEMAEASGIQLVPVELRDAYSSTTWGTGELINAALEAGAESIVLTIGGSATNDGGAGMLQALGARLLDADGIDLKPGGASLLRLASIDISGLDPRLSLLSVKVAADVDNPLCGPNGASTTFGRQKGASPEQIVLLDAALSNFAEHVAHLQKKDWRKEPGAGAGGGIGFAALSFFNATFRPGVDVVADLTQLARHVDGADLVVTGEGRFDGQTLRGKTPLGVARVAQQAGVSVVVIAGTLGEGYAQLYEHGISAAFSIVSGPMELADACLQAPQLLRERARDVGNLYRLALQTR
ncbi:glycerate kinase [Pseudomonas extremaustralis]|uniref:glycerate kinase n=1 Tax=Pseudomonas extremaustralis TaxID=359110 RepID=UPI00285E18B6|nr:glycerate kinase [Pseudomonas extremaustralis]MDR6580924.1 glycerate kinase [Pseudomonas extremaustralis]